MVRISLSLSLLALIGCGAEEAAPETEPAPREVTEPAPPPPEPEPVPECPEDTWAVGSQGTNTPAENGAAAANLFRSAMRGGWERVSVCRTVDGEAVQMICSPARVGADCSLAIPGQRCTTAMPIPLLSGAVGQFVDTSAVPDNFVWRCSAAR